MPRGSKYVVQQMVDERLLVRNVAFDAAAFEDLLEILPRRVLGEDLVVNAAEERFVDEVGRPQVRREHDQQHERNRNLLTRFERQVVDRGSRAA